MSRHSKNNTAHSIFTYHERQMLKDFGTNKLRLGEDSMRKFEQCWLCLRTASKPVVSRKGYLFCKKCIMLNFAEQKNLINKKRKLYEDYCIKEDSDSIKKIEKEKLQTISKFIDSEIHVPTKEFDQNSSNSIKLKQKDIIFTESSINLDIISKTDKSTKEGLRSKSFWIAENTPSSTNSKVDIPDLNLKCPISNTILKLKDLKEVNPEFLTEDSENSKWICSISKKIIAHQQAVLIVPTKQIALKEYVDKYVLGQKGYCANPITVNDIIPIIQGGSAFSSHNKVEAERKRVTM